MTARITKRILLKFIEFYHFWEGNRENKKQERNNCLVIRLIFTDLQFVIGYCTRNDDEQYRR